MIIALDFDGTLCITNKLGEEIPNFPVISKTIEAKKKGHELILWTCRGEEWLQEAIEFCKDYGLEFDSINKNIPNKNYTRYSCKVIADLYVDDKAPGSIDYFLEMEL